MDKTFSAGIDHCTIMHRDLQTAADVYFPLGFVGDGNCTALSESVRGAFVPSVRFVFENAYLECACFPPELEEFYHFLKSDAGVHMTTLLTDSAERFRAALLARGQAIPEIVVTEREGADHGEKKGKAVFHLVEIPDGAIPDTHMAFLEHMTRELIYQPHPHRHPNTAETFEEMVLCMDDEALAERIGSQLAELCALANSDLCPGGLRRVRVVDPAAFEAEFGYAAQPERCVFSALVFGVADMDVCRRWVAGAGFAWHERDGVLYVNVMEKQSLVLCFRPRQK